MANLRRIARRKARKYGLDPGIFQRQIQQESGFNPTISSPAGAQGVAQIMPATARAWGVDPLKPRQALDAAAKNMASYVKKYGSYENALRAYNAGPGAIERSKGFSETNNYVRTILGGRDPKRLSAPRKGASGNGSGGKRQGRPGTTSTSSTTTTSTTPGVDNSALRQSLKVSYLQTRDSDPNALLNLAQGLKGAQDTPGTTTTSTTSRTSRSGAGGGGAAPDNTATSPDTKGSVGRITKRMKRIDSRRFPYKWGGGHEPGAADKAVPLDCSGAVSKALGIDARVASQFKAFGKSGYGKKVTIFAKDDHVLMAVKRKGQWHYWGTSRSNPGGGAGWIPESAVSSSYLSGFTARHPAGM